MAPPFRLPTISLPSAPLEREYRDHRSRSSSVNLSLARSPSIPTSSSSSSNLSHLALYDLEHQSHLLSHEQPYHEITHDSFFPYIRDRDRVHVHAQPIHATLPSHSTSTHHGEGFDSKRERIGAKVENTPDLNVTTSRSRGLVDQFDSNSLTLAHQPSSSDIGTTTAGVGSSRSLRSHTSDDDLSEDNGRPNYQRRNGPNSEDGRQDDSVGRVGGSVEAGGKTVTFASENEFEVFDGVAVDDNGMDGNDFQRPNRHELALIALSVVVLLSLSVAAGLTTIYNWVL